MRYLSLLALPIAALLLTVAQPAQAGWPPCRDVTAGLPAEYMENNYVYADGTHLEFWREWNGYTGLQRQKCITETGIVLGRDTLESRTDTSDPNQIHPGLPSLPDPQDPAGPPMPNVPDIEPQYPTMCGSGYVDNPTAYIGPCSQLPPPPTAGTPGHGCQSRPVVIDETLAWTNCVVSGDDEDPGVISYVNWLQYVFDWMT